MSDIAPEAAATAAEQVSARPSLVETAAAIAGRVTPRAWVRAGFWTFFVWSCWQLWRFYQWALGAGPWVQRPEATAGLVPLGALMGLAAWMKSGVFDPVMPAAVIIVLAALAVSLLLKRGFCGWVCPVGTTVSVFAWAGRKLAGGRPRPMPRWLDVALRVPKYVAGAFLLGSVVLIPAQVAIDFQLLPYYATSDMKILYGLLNPAWGYWVVAGLVAATTVAVGTNTWCRYLCPLGAVYGGVSVLSAGTVKRDPDACIDCKACDKACSARIEVSRSLRAVRSAECDGCQDCARACPAPGALTARLGGLAIPWQVWPVLILTLWLLVWAIAVGTGHWQHGLADDVVAGYMRTMKLTHDF